MLGNMTFSTFFEKALMIFLSHSKRVHICYFFLPNFQTHVYDRMSYVLKNRSRIPGEKREHLTVSNMLKGPYEENHLGHIDTYIFFKCD